MKTITDTREKIERIRESMHKLLPGKYPRTLGPESYAGGGKHVPEVTITEHVPIDSKADGKASVLVTPLVETCLSTNTGKLTAAELAELEGAIAGATAEAMKGIK